MLIPRRTIGSFLVAIGVCALLMQTGCEAPAGSGWRWTGRQSTTEQPRQPATQPAEPSPSDALAQRVEEYVEAMHEPPSADSLADRLDRQQQAESTGPAEAESADEPALAANTEATIQPALAAETDAVQEALAEQAQRPLPRLLSVQVLAGSKADVAQPALPPRPQSNQPLSTLTQTQRHALDELLEELRRQVAEHPNDLERQLQLRMLHLIRGEPAAALEETPNADQDNLQLLRGLVQIIDGVQRIPAVGDAGPALGVVREFEQLLQERSDLVVPRVALCRQVRSFGDYQPIEPPVFTSGQDHPVIVYVEVANFLSAPTTDERFRTALNLQAEVLTPDGKQVWSKDAQAIEDISRNRRRDFFLAQVIRLPASLESGDYVLRVLVEDTLAAKVASNTVSFTCQPGGAAATASLR
jgi:hypothetical protein